MCVPLLEIVSFALIKTDCNVVSVLGSRKWSWIESAHLHTLRLVVPWHCRVASLYRRKWERRQHAQMSWTLSREVTFMWCDSPWHFLVFHYKSERLCFHSWVAVASGTQLLSELFSGGQPTLIVKHPSNTWRPAGRLAPLGSFNLPF